jgi:hypothetical protein
VDANGIKKIEDPAEAVETLDKFVNSVYKSSPPYVRDQDAGACDMEAMTSITCGKEDPWKVAPWASALNNQPVRGVNIDGLFVLRRWITTGLLNHEGGSYWSDDIFDQLSFSKACGALKICDRLTTHWKSFYTEQDFTDIKVTTTF